MRGLLLYQPRGELLAQPSMPDTIDLAAKSKAGMPVLTKLGLIFGLPVGVCVILGFFFGIYTWWKGKKEPPLKRNLRKIADAKKHYRQRTDTGWIACRAAVLQRGGGGRSLLLTMRSEYRSQRRSTAAYDRIDAFFQDVEVHRKASTGAAPASNSAGNLFSTPALARPNQLVSNPIPGYGNAGPSGANAAAAIDRRPFVDFYSSDGPGTTDHRGGPDHELARLSTSRGAKLAAEPSTDANFNWKPEESLPQPQSNENGGRQNFDSISRPSAGANTSRAHTADRNLPATSVGFVSQALMNYRQRQFTAPNIAQSAAHGIAATVSDVDDDSMYDDEAATAPSIGKSQPRNELSASTFATDSGATPRGRGSQTMYPDYIAPASRTENPADHVSDAERQPTTEPSRTSVDSAGTTWHSTRSRPSTDNS